jgi:hypothetical protein
MSDQDRQDLIQLVESDKRNCLAFLKANNIKVKNKIGMLMKTGSINFHLPTFGNCNMNQV